MQQHDCPVDISKKALEEVKNILETKGIPSDYGLRIATKGMGCGVGFKLGFDKKKDTDETFIKEGVLILIQKKEMLFLVGKKIEFYDEADGRGFLFA